MKSRARLLVALGVLLIVAGCKAKQDGGGAATSNAGDAPQFILAWSEYPSWSVFGVADELGLIAGEPGKLGTLEEKHGVDIVLKDTGYDSCLNMYVAGNCDAVCITNMDALIQSENRRGVAVLPTSTSYGADACLVTDQIADVDALKQHKVYGLENTVSEYCFVRCLELAGKNEADYQFSNQDPAIAAQNMQRGNAEHQAIMVWNPFVLQTLKERSDVRVLFDSEQIQGEIVDMVVIGADSMEREGAADFVRAVSEAFYGVNAELEGDRRDEVLVALGSKFSKLELPEMKEVVKQTAFYKTPDEAKALFSGDDLKRTMEIVEKFCVDHDLVENPSIGYDPGSDAKLKFDASYIE